MRLAGITAAVLVSDDGRAVLELAGINLSDEAALFVGIEESEDLGLWIRIARQDQSHICSCCDGNIFSASICRVD